MFDVRHPLILTKGIHWLAWFPPNFRFDIPYWFRQKIGHNEHGSSGCGETALTSMSAYSTTPILPESEASCAIYGIVLWRFWAVLNRDPWNLLDSSLFGHLRVSEEMRCECLKWLEENAFWHPAPLVFVRVIVFRADDWSKVRIDVFHHLCK